MRYAIWSLKLRAWYAGQKSNKDMWTFKAKKRATYRKTDMPNHVVRRLALQDHEAKVVPIEEEHRK